ncbi:MAG: ABC-F type ribosomal protection protein [Clostridiales bacterium]|nr:ABC-F type ribosomal protection protein [Clostridiales bacterium]
MSMIKVQGLTFSYDGGFTDVFNNVCFNIDTNWKLGFVGRNGRGKTTFLKLLLGAYEYKGSITSSVRFTYFPFEVNDKTRLSIEVLGDICDTSEYWRLQRELNKLKLDEELLYRPFDTLSGGERTKLMLAGLFLNDGNFLLIDEPTNHLDSFSRETVAQYLNGKSGFILVSHDRAFLDDCVDHILSINKTNIEVQSGNFSSWFENFERQQAFEATQNDRLKKEVKKLTEAARRTSEWAQNTEKEKSRNSASNHSNVMGTRVDKGYIGHKAAKLQKRAKAIEARREDAVEQKSQLLKNTEYAADLKLSPLSYRAERLAYADNISVTYGDAPVFPPMSLEIKRGERIALCGKNGCGKSSLIKLIAGKELSHTGRLVIPADLKISYVPQHADHLSGSLKDFATLNEIDETLFNTILRKMDFKRDELFSDISSLSEGQKKKVLIAKSLCQSAHLYVWDEPLNYIDIYSRMQIEKLLNEFAPTMIFVEHDAAFRSNIATRTIKM